MSFSELCFYSETVQYIISNQDGYEQEDQDKMGFPLMV